jgi:hypothetical protein
MCVGRHPSVEDIYSEWLAFKEPADRRDAGRFEGDATAVGGRLFPGHAGLDQVGQAIGCQAALVRGESLEDLLARGVDSPDRDRREQPAAAPLNRRCSGG